MEERLDPILFEEFLHDHSKVENTMMLLAFLFYHWVLISGC